VLTEVEAMETRAVTERGSTKEALTQILLLNEAVLSSAVAAIRAEEEGSSVFFQVVTCELFNSDKNLEVIRRQTEMLQGMEKELLAKTVTAVGAEASQGEVQCHLITRGSRCDS
jgi:hypothetical protein